MSRFYLILALLLLATPASARAEVTMDPIKPCYVSEGVEPSERETIAIHAQGFTPLAALTMQIDGQTVAKGQAGAFGETSAFVPAPFEGRREREFTLAVVEDQNPNNAVTALSRVTTLAVTLKPRRAAPSRKVLIRGRGFTAPKPVYGHYVFGGKVRKTVRFAKLSKAPCGLFRTRRKQIPVRRPAMGDWMLQVDQQRRYSPHPETNAQRVIIRVRQSVKQP